MCYKAEGAPRAGGRAGITSGWRAALTKPELDVLLTSYDLKRLDRSVGNLLTAPPIMCLGTV